MSHCVLCVVFKTKHKNMILKLYLTILFTISFASLLMAQVPSQMQLTPADSLFQKFNLNPNDFSDQDLFDEENQLSEYFVPTKQPDGFKGLMPIIVPDDRYDYKLKIYKPDGNYKYSMPVLEPIMIERYYRS